MPGFVDFADDVKKAIIFLAEGIIGI